MLLEGKTTIDTGQFEARGRLRIHGFQVATFAEGKRSNLGIENAHLAPTMCVCLIHRLARVSLPDYIIASGIFIYELLLASIWLIVFSVKKFVQRKFSPLSEKFFVGKNYCRDRPPRKQFLNTR